MDLPLARWLVSDDAAPWRDWARQAADPSALATGAALRQHLAPDRAAAVLDLEALRRRAGPKSDSPEALFFTRQGLEQATRWQVAAWRAGQVAARARRVVDLGCGLGIDARAFAQAGLAVVGVERDPVTATFAAANLADTAAVVRAAAIEEVDLDPWLGDPDCAVLVDPSRRGAHGRSWRLADLSPSWGQVAQILDQAAGPVVVKLAPGFPRHLLPPGADVTWVSHRGDLVETTVWSSRQSTGQRTAVLLGPSGTWRLAAGPALPGAGALDRFVHEPDPAVSRSGAAGALAQRLGAHPLADQVAYLTGPSPSDTPAATSFEVDQVLDWSPSALRGWARAHQVGALEIKVRGLDVDPARLRRQLRLAGHNAATVILTPTTQGAALLVVRRVGGGPPPAHGDRPTGNTHIVNSGARGR
jgi:hypothetical protein